MCPLRPAQKPTARYEANPKEPPESLLHAAPSYDYVTCPSDRGSACAESVRLGPPPPRWDEVEDAGNGNGGGPLFFAVPLSSSDRSAKKVRRAPSCAGHLADTMPSFDDVYSLLRLVMPAEPNRACTTTTQVHSL